MEPYVQSLTTEIADITAQIAATSDTLMTEVLTARLATKNGELVYANSIIQTRADQAAAKQAAIDEMVYFEGDIITTLITYCNDNNIRGIDRTLECFCNMSVEFKNNLSANFNSYTDAEKRQIIEYLR